MIVYIQHSLILLSNPSCVAYSFLIYIELSVNKEQCSHPHVLDEVHTIQLNQVFLNNANIHVHHMLFGKFTYHHKQFHCIMLSPGINTHVSSLIMINLDSFILFLHSICIFLLSHCLQYLQQNVKQPLSLVYPVVFDNRLFLFIALIQI